MTCTGCSGAIDRVLKKTDGMFSLPFSLISASRTDVARGIIGLSSYDVNLESQEVIVKTDKVSYEEVLAKIKKTGKEVRSGEVVGEGAKAV